MNIINLASQTPQNNRVSKLIKTFDLKHLKIPKNEEQISITFFRKNRTYGTTRNKPIKQIQYYSLEKVIKNNENKIKYILSDKNINKNHSNDMMNHQKKIFNSSSKFKSNTHLQSYKEFENNTKENKYQKLRISQTLDSRRNSSNNKINSYPQFSKDNKKISQKNHIINKRFNDYNLNSNSVINKSIRHHTTIQSTVSTFVPAILSPQKDSSLIRKKVNLKLKK